MTEPKKPPLSRIEHDLMICGIEAWGILAYATGDRDEDGNPVDLPATVLSLVDRGWVTIHRIEPWTAPHGKKGATYSEPLPREEIPAVLADPATWDDPQDASWMGAITLSATEAGRDILRG
ncbi:hypothetical protein [Streptacidiphilus monticola]|uniref:Uncharacterized protein n=1 Tax=Streptacidiphilus monticola TaxID=2161674 RepID=A0ABW1G6M8_9ACTN